MATETQIQRIAYRPNELPQLLGVSRSRVFELLKTGELASVGHGRTRLISRRAIDRFLGLDEAA